MIHVIYVICLATKGLFGCIGRAARCIILSLLVQEAGALSKLVCCPCRIWNHHRQECVLKRQLTDDPVDLSMHCSGLTILIAYSDKVQMLYILR